MGELEYLPLGKEEADCAVISMVLHHLSKPEAAIAEAGRILKPEGVLIITDFHKHRNEQMRHIYNDRWLGFSSQEMTTWLSGNGFILESNNPGELAGKIKALEPESERTKIENINSNRATDFTNEQHIAKVLELYNKVSNQNK